MRFGSLLTIAACLLCALAVSARGQEFQVVPGMVVEVLDGAGDIRGAEFVSMVGTTHVKVKMKDGNVLTFPVNRVRVPQARSSTGGSVGPRVSVPGSITQESPEAIAAAGKLAGLRTWTDASGKFTIEAEFVTTNGERVELKKADGSVVQMPLERLSGGDQEIAGFLAYRQAMQARLAATGDGSVGATGKISLSGVTRLDLPVAMEWSVKVDPNPTPPKTLINKPVYLPPRDLENNYQDRYEAVLIDSANHWGWLTFRNGSSSDSQYRLERIDLQTGRILPVVFMPRASKVLSISPSGKLLAVAQIDPSGYNKSQLLQIWEVSLTGLRWLKTLQPFENDSSDYDENETNIRLAEFIDDDNLLLQNQEKDLLLLDVKQAKPKYLIEANRYRYENGRKTTWVTETMLGRTTPAFSPGRKYLAIPGAKSGVRVIESLTGTVVGECATTATLAGEAQVDRVVFHPDGTKLAATTPRGVWVWNVADGKLLQNWAGVDLREEGTFGDELAFGSHQHLIINRRSAFHLQQGMVTCTFDLKATSSQSGDGSKASAAGREWRVVETNVQDGYRSVRVFGLTSYLVPGDDVMREFNKLNLDSLIVMPPGARIRTNIAFPASAAEVTRIQASLAKELSDCGWKLVGAADDCDFVLHCIIETGATREHTYYTDPYGRETVRANVTYLNGRITLVKAKTGEQVWNKLTQWGPRQTYRLEPGQTLADATLVQPSMEFFGSPRIPQRFVNYPPRQGIFQAYGDEAGVQVRVAPK
ncbi:SHD1 domain-containing protein [Anatilimnocola sp. NA78]|uniref:SHD1 domain-containing protein n=1 Tax=Anatilimnocola sp. NA78 TaxID=3415683 RepID=UPI003CE4BF58